VPHIARFVGSMILPVLLTAWDGARTSSTTARNESRSMAHRVLWGDSNSLDPASPVLFYMYSQDSVVASTSFC